ncbi:MAG: hypothetical protein Q9222_001325 [Ikaeria aurantiellina]
MNITAIAVGVIVVTLSLIIHQIRSRKPELNQARFKSVEHDTVSVTLAHALPESVFFGPHPVFVESIQSYWAIQERDIVPQCVIRPRTANEVAIAVGILKVDYDERMRNESVPLHVVVRSGGHSPVPGAANTDGGIVIDLRLLNEVVTSKDRSSVVIGSGARWLDVSKSLDEQGLAVAGGRNSAVGLGGLALGGGFMLSMTGSSRSCLLHLQWERLCIHDLYLTALLSETNPLSGGLSFFSPCVGFVCNNIVAYEIVLANGTITTASETVNSGLWRALKGGSNNFGIVTNFVARSFPSANIWSDFLYMSPSKASQVIDAFYHFTKAKPSLRDEQKFVTTTVKNDRDTLLEIHATFKRGAEAIRLVKDMI